MNFEEREIDFFDMICSVCLRWKVIFLVGLFCFAVSTSYMLLKGEIRHNDRELEYIDLEEFELSASDRDLLEMYHMYNDYYLEQVERNNNNELMDINPEDVYYTCLEYIISNSSDNAVISRILADAILADRELNDKFSAFTNAETNSFGNDYLVSYDDSSKIDEDFVSKSILRVYIYEKDEESCNEVSNKMKEYVLNQKDQVSKYMGSFDLTLVFERCAQADKSLLVNYVHSQKELEYNGYNARKIVYNNLNSEVCAYIDAEEYNKSIDEMDSENLIKANEKNINKKLLILVTFVSMFLVIAMYLVIYIFNTKLRFEDNPEKIFDISLLAAIPTEVKKKGITGFIYELRRRKMHLFDEKDSIEMIASEIKVKLKNENIKKVFVTGSRMEARECKLMEELATILKKSEIEVEIGKPILYFAEAMEESVDVGNILLVEKAYEAEYAEINKEINASLSRNVNLLGLVVVE